MKHRITKTEIGLIGALIAVAAIAGAEGLSMGSTPAKLLPKGCLAVTANVEDAQLISGDSYHLPSGEWCAK